MNCKKARIYFPSFAACDLEGRAAKRVADHLMHCPDCQMSFEKTRKLRALLALKRHEQPDEFFFRTYVSEFHRRLYSEMIKRKPFWSALRAIFDRASGMSWVLRATIPVAAAMVILLGLYSSHVSQENNRALEAVFRQSQAHHVAVVRSESLSSKVHPVWNDMVLNDRPLDRNTVYVLDRIANTPAAHESIVLSF